MELYPYQEKGVAFLAGRERAYLADGMGLGKSVQALAAAKRLNLRKVLVIAPAATLPNWRSEAEIWGVPGWTFEAVSYADKRLRNGTFNGEDWDVVIVDEAHYIKNPKAKRTINVLRVATAAPRAWLLSGTPMPNHAGELWTAVAALWPQELKPEFRTAGKWLRYFCRYTETRYGPRVYGHKNASELRGILRRNLLRRKLEDVGLDLPPLRVALHRLPKPDDWVLDHDAKEMLTRLEHEEGRDDPATSRIRRLLGTLKAPLIAKTISNELDDRQYRKIVVLYHHTAVGDILHEALEDFGVVRLDGRSSDRDRLVSIARFSEDDDVRVFLGQQTSAGTGLNLQVANEIVLVEPAWSPDDNRQAVKRVHRIGQENPCRARVFAVSGTLDEAVMKTIALKTQLQETVGLR